MRAGQDRIISGSEQGTENIGTRREMDHLVQEIKENLKLDVVTGPLSPGGAAGSGNCGGGKLKAGGGLKARSSYSHRVASHRSTPYHVPPSSRQCDSASGGPVNPGDGATLNMRRKQRWGRRRYPSTCMNNNKFVDGVDGPDDPFAMLQELISDGSLIKEAVRRLQLGPPPPDGFSAGRLTPGSNNNRASGRHTAYDSDSDNEDCRTPPESDHSEQVQEAGAVATVRSRTFPCCEVGL